MNKLFVSTVVASIFLSSAWAFTSCPSARINIGNRAITIVWGSKWDSLIDEDEELDFRVSHV
jgi:hypothetical protein